MVQNAALAPNGLMEATMFPGDGSGGQSGQVRWAEGVPNLVPGQLYRVSLYVKKGVGSDEWLLLSNSSFTDVQDRSAQYFNIVTGAEGVINGSGVNGIESANLTYPDAPAGWWRIWGHLRPLDDVLGNIDIYQRQGDTNPTGNTVGNTFYGWGFQMEPVSTTLGRPSDLVETGATVPVTNLNRVFDDAGPTVVTVTNEVGYTHELTKWFQQSNIAVQDYMERVDGVPVSRITDDGTLGYHYVGQVNQYPFDNTRRRLSCYVKQGTARYVIFSDRIPSASNTQWSAIFDMQDGVWTFQGTLYVGLWEAEQFDTGEWRISFVSAIASGAYDNIYIGISNGPTKEDQFYTGTGSYLYAGGAQVEYGTDASPGPLVRNDGSGTGADGKVTDSFGWERIGLWKGAIEPSEYTVWGTPSSEQTLVAGANQEVTANLLGSITLPVGVENSSQVAVPPTSAQILKTGISNTQLTVRLTD